MELKAIIHEAEEGGFWAEVPALPGCVTQADSLPELEINLHEAIEGCLLAVELEMSVESPDAAEDQPHRQLWADEARRRRDDIRSGLVKTIPGHVALSKVREALAQR